MPLNKAKAGQYLKEFNFKPLFIELLGWDKHEQHLPVEVDGKTYKLTAIAHKRGMVAFECTYEGAQPPEYPIRRKIDQQVTKNVREHIIIYTDSARTLQIWQWVKREAGKPIACREHHFHRNQSGEALLQKLEAIKVGLEEEEQLTIVDVAVKAKVAFDVEKITKRFYDRFKAEHDGFLKFIKGIPDAEFQQWYASVMLNRLMFIYFIQKKGFLDNNTDYLRKKLASSKERGKDRFHTDFLSPLFFEGFAKKETDRSAAINKLLGKIPYLNGGLFLKHQIEEQYGKHIQISDAAFEKIFAFFDQYQWHLDERPLKEGNEINPDVLGYIFEKYINQKQMGAYYTKEDITEYISKSTVIPYLFDVAKQKCKIAFEGNNTVWRLLQIDPDRYIYDAVKKGVELPLPEEIAKGLKDVEKRIEWNKPASDAYALPTEIWREVVARRKRYEEVRTKLANGEIRDINDFITYNLNIRQFAHDVIENSEGPELLRAFYHAIEKVTVLDPTCGSGAFLFAALNILEPLYEACLDRMEVFLNELERSGEKHRPEKYSDFRKILNQIEKHPDRRYFILKSVVINNLYGVDIMEEAIEICKLRLFLKLMAQIERVEDIEPLPDIDFNIRAGNTLVGFTSLDDIKHAMEGDMIKLLSLPAIEEKVDIVDRAFQKFREMQTDYGMDSKDFLAAKYELKKRIKILENELNSYLATEYGVDFNEKAAYEKWLLHYKPFHWFMEFHAVIKSGGFDVVIGNPPYVEYSKIKKDYEVGNFVTKNCGNIYAFTVERSFNLISSKGLVGLIVPLSIISTERMKSLQLLCHQAKRTFWFSSYDVYPSKLFEGAKQRLTILLASNQRQQVFIWTTAYNRWRLEEREWLFPKLNYYPSYLDEFLSVIPKLSGEAYIKVFKKIENYKPAPFIWDTGRASFYVHRIPYNYIKAFDFVPYFWNEVDGQKKSEDYKPYFINDPHDAKVALAILSSNLFFWWWYANFEGYHCGKHELSAFPMGIESMADNTKSKLVKIADNFMKEIKENKKRKTCYYKHTGKVVYDEFYPRLSKPIIDLIDRTLADHYGFSSEELDAVINYDIKYRFDYGLIYSNGKDEADESEDEF